MTTKKYICLFIICFIIWGLCNYKLYHIPTKSMENTLFPGDYIVVKRIKHSKAGFFNKPMLKSKINRGDILAFSSRNKKQSKILVKRCIAVPGDTLHFIRDSILLNGVFQEFPDSAKFLYSIESLSTDKLKILTDSLNIESIVFNSGRVQICSTPNMISFLISESLIKEANPVRRSVQNGAFKHQGYSKFIIPTIDDIVTNDSILLDIYGNTYTKLEESNKTVKNSYYYMMGDNRHVSIDSRFFGVIAESQIIGRICIILRPSGDKDRLTLIKKKRA